MAKRIYTVYGVLGLEHFQHMRIGRYATLTAATDAAKQHSRYDAACTIVRDGVTVAKFRNGLTTDRIVPPLAVCVNCERPAIGKQPIVMGDGIVGMIDVCEYCVHPTLGLTVEPIMPLNVDHGTTVNGPATLPSAKLCSWCDATATHKLSDRSDVDYACDQHVNRVHRTYQLCTKLN